MKRISVGFNQSRANDVEADKENLKYQKLLEEYLDLQKEYVSKKRKLRAAKQKRESILAEVRFLKRRHKHLLKSQAPNADKDLLHLPTADSQTNTLQRRRNPSSIDKLMLSNSNPEGSSCAYTEDVRRSKQIKNGLIQDKVKGKRKRKRKISSPDQFTLNL